MQIEEHSIFIKLMHVLKYMEVARACHDVCTGPCSVCETTGEVLLLLLLLMLSRLPAAGTRKHNDAGYFEMFLSRGSRQPVSGVRTVIIIVCAA